MQNHAILPCAEYLPTESAAGEEDPGASIDQLPPLAAVKPMHLVQILLPLYDYRSMPFSKSKFDAVKKELVAQFGGMTAYARAPASGLWMDAEGGEGDVSQIVRDQLVVYEVMAKDLDRVWWAEYRSALAQRFGQKELVVRAQAIELL